MATVIAATPPPHSPPSPAATVPVHYPLTGFVRIEEDSGRHRNNGRSSSSSKSASSAKAKGKVCSRWLYAVLLPGTLQLYERRQDYKRHTPPSEVIHMEVRARSPNESVFGFDQECVYIRSSDTGHVITVRIHQKKEIVRWVTALYYQSFSSKSPVAATCAASAVGKHDSEQQPEPTSINNQTGELSSRTKRKSVSFQEEPEVLVLPRQSVDKAELFYSEREYVQFQQKNSSAAADEDDGVPQKKNLSRLMKSIYAKTAAKLKVSPKKTMEELR